MATRAFSVEDGNLNSRSIITTRNKLFSDIDLTFSKRPSGDIFKKVDAAAVKQAVKNLLLTNAFEKPFQPTFGGNLNALLFELVDDESSHEIENVIVETITRFEPRAKVISVVANVEPDYNAVAVTVTFQVVNTEEVVTFETTLTRLR
jgi:phage baseplate assembly protein W